MRLRYGAIPVVSRVGGLADSVIDANEAALAAGVATGIQFWPATPEALDAALHRLLALWRDRPAWERIQRNGMAADVSWRGPASRYVALYQSIAGGTVLDGAGSVSTGSPGSRWASPSAGRRHQRRGACARRRCHRDLPVRRATTRKPAASACRPAPDRCSTAISRGVPAGTRYGLRAFGPWDPANGHRFNPSKLLVDPWATAIDRPFRLHPLLFDRDGPRPEDTAALVPKAIVGAPPVAPGRPTARSSTGTARSSTSCMSAASP